MSTDRSTLDVGFEDGKMVAIITLDGERIPEGTCLINDKIVPSGTKIPRSGIVHTCAFSTGLGRVFASQEDYLAAMAGTFEFPEE